MQRRDFFKAAAVGLTLAPEVVLARVEVEPLEATNSIRTLEELGKFLDRFHAGMKRHMPVGFKLSKFYKSHDDRVVGCVTTGMFVWSVVVPVDRLLVASQFRAWKILEHDVLAAVDALWEKVYRNRCIA